jgi:Beta-propeller domains of methanol dehydrogenase type
LRSSSRRLPAVAQPENTFPSTQVSDLAHILGPDAEWRLAQRLHKFYALSGDKVSIQVYVAAGTKGRGADAPIADLVQQWKSQPGGRDADTLTMLFAFVDEHDLRLYLGSGVPPAIKEALENITPQKLANVQTDLEPAIEKTIDRIAADLHLETAPPPAAQPEGPIFGKPVNDGSFDSPNVLADADLPMIASALAEASKDAGGPIVLLLNPERGLDRPEQITGTIEAERPAETLLFVYQTDKSAVLRPSPALRSHFSDAAISRIETQIAGAMTHKSSSGTLRRALVRLIGDIGALGAGHPRPEWNAGMHPLEKLAGGPDAEWRDGIIPALFLLVLLGLLAYLGVLFVRDPVGTTIDLLFLLAEGALMGIAGGGGGGGGDSGGGFSGAGGGFGGGGASGSW